MRFQAAAIACRSAQTAVGYELDRMRRALELSGVEVPVIVLKGAAYKLADLPASRGRFIGDLDLMVAFDHVDTVEGALLAKGSPLTACVSKAVEAIRSSGQLAKINQQWLGEAAGAPELQ